MGRFLGAHYACVLTRVPHWWERGNVGHVAVQSGTMKPMGYLMYSNCAEYEFDDRTLAHLKVAINMKLRRQECFLMSWTNPVEKGSGRVSLWLSPNIPLVFRFSGSRAPQLNEAWLRVLNELSHTPRGLVVVEEKEAEEYLARQEPIRP